MNPLVPRQAMANRAWLRRVVEFLAHQGVRQFLDIGSGIPTSGNVHNIVAEFAPDARVVYVDIDPVAVVTTNNILDGNSQACAIHGDLGDPDYIVGQLERSELKVPLDLDMPTALLLVAILHFVPPESKPLQAVSKLRDRLVSGSYLAINHGATESYSLAERIRIRNSYRQKGAHMPRSRTREQVAEFFGDFQLVEPGVVWLPEWRPGSSPVDFADDPVHSGSHSGVARKR